MRPAGGFAPPDPRGVFHERNGGESEQAAAIEFFGGEDCGEAFAVGRIGELDAKLALDIYF